MQTSLGFAVALQRKNLTSIVSCSKAPISAHAQQCSARMRDLDSCAEHRPETCSTLVLLPAWWPRPSKASTCPENWSHLLRRLCSTEHSLHKAARSLCLLAVQSHSAACCGIVRLCAAGLFTNGCLQDVSVPRAPPHTTHTVCTATLCCTCVVLCRSCLAAVFDPITNWPIAGRACAAPPSCGPPSAALHTVCTAAWTAPLHCTCVELCRSYLAAVSG